MKKTVLFFALLVVAFSSIRAQQDDFSFTESFAVDSPSNLVIKSSDSNIDVSSHDENVIEVHYRIKRGNQILNLTKDEFKDAISDQSRIDVSKTGSDIKIERISLIKDHIDFDDKIIVDFKVFVPKATMCKIYTNDGNISLTGLDLNQTCITNDGNIYLTDLTGNIIAETNDADIFFKNVTGRVDGKTNDGSIIDLDKGGR